MKKEISHKKTAVKIPVAVLEREIFLIVDNAPFITKHIEFRLKQIFEINGLDYNKFKHTHVQATSDDAFRMIVNYKNIMVSTSFTTIKSNAVEDLIKSAIQYRLQDKNVFSLMQFSLVAEDFEDYKPEIRKLRENNVLFYFISEDHTFFNLYQS